MTTVPTEQNGKSEAPSKANEQGFSLNMSRGFTNWLALQNASLAITTYQVGKVIFFGVDKDKKFWSFNRNIGRCLGMVTDPDSQGFWVSSDVQFYRFESILKQDEVGPAGSDAYYAPRMSYFTGDLDIHDVGLDKDGQPIFVNTLFNCLARPSATKSFEAIWSPSFISRLAAEDRCHLNGLAMVDGEPGFVTAVSESDIFNGWRGHRQDGGVVINVTTNEIVCRGLSMPHSPRWHEGRLWLHNSGQGEFGYVDFKKGEFVPVAFCPGYLRGLDFINGHAVVGLSLPRDNKTFSGLALNERLKEQKIEPIAGLYFINLKSGDVVHSITFKGIVTEMYDVNVIKNIKQPSAIGPTSEEVKRTLAI